MKNSLLTGVVPRSIVPDVSARQQVTTRSGCDSLRGPVLRPPRLTGWPD